MTARMRDTPIGVILAGPCRSDIGEWARRHGHTVNSLASEDIASFLLTSPGEWAVVARASTVPELHIDRFTAPLVVDMRDVEPAQISDPGLNRGLSGATALFGVSPQTALFLEDYVAISPQVLQDFDTALHVASSRFLMVIGAGLGNVVQSTPAIRAVAETVGHPIDVFITNANAAPLIGRSHVVNMALTDRSMLERRHYHHTFVASSAGRFVPPVSTDALVTQRPRFEMTKAGEWMHESAFYTLGLTDLLPDFRMSNRQRSNYFISDYEYEMPKSGVVGICSGKRPGIWERRGWGHFEDLADRIRQLGYETWSFGSKEEYVPGTLDKTGTGLRQNVSDMLMCEFFVATDGGIYHMAEALGIPTLVLFGPTSVIKNGPNARTTRVAHTLEPCSPCQWKIDFHRCKDPICTSEMTTQFVYAEFERLVRESAAGPESDVSDATTAAERVRLHERERRNAPYRPEFAPAYSAESFSEYPRSTEVVDKVVRGRGRIGDLARVDEIISHFDRTEPGMLHAAISAAFDGGDYSRVVDNGLKHLTAAPDDSAIRLLVMRALAKQSEWQRIVDLYDEATLTRETSPFETAELSFLCGVALRELRRYAEAVSCFETAMSARPGVRRYVTERDSLRTDLYRHPDYRQPVDSERSHIAVITPPNSRLPDWATGLSRRGALFNYHTTELDLLERDASQIDGAIALDDVEIPGNLVKLDIDESPGSIEDRTRIVLFAHHHLARWEPRGGELSMLAIVHDLLEKGAEVRVVVANRKNREVFTERLEDVDYVVAPHHRFEATVENVLELYRPDIALMWGKPSLVAAPICKERGVPTLVFVRYWYTVCDPPYDGDLLTDPIDEARFERQSSLFEAADAVITNAHYVSQVIERLHRVQSSVAYVPVHAPPATWVSPASDERPHVTLVNPRKAGGEHLLRELAQRLPTVPFLAIGHPYPAVDMPPNVTTQAYDDSPYFEMLASTNVLLFPFDEDPCGTGRVPLEALHCGIPVIGASRGGLGEVIPQEWLVPWDDVDAWEQLVEDLYFDGSEDDRRRAFQVARGFDPTAGLRLVEETINRLTGGRWNQ